MSWKGLMNDMKHNLLEKLGVSIPQLGLGCMRLPTDNDTIDYAHAQKNCRLCYEKRCQLF